MKVFGLIFLLLVTISAFGQLKGTIQVKNPNNTEKYYKLLMGSTFIQTSNLVEDTMLLYFRRDTILEFGYTYLQRQGQGKLKKNRMYYLNCSNVPCHIDFIPYEYMDDGAKKINGIIERGIIEFLGEGQFILRFNSESLDTRPITFKPIGDKDIIEFKLIPKD